VYEGSDPWEVAGNLEVDLDGLGRLSAAIPDGFMSADTFAELGDEVMPPWVVPGWLRQGDRTIVVAEEGVGKSVFTLQVAMLAAQGVNPLWTPHRFDPCTTLVLDLENPAYVLRDRVRDLRSRLQLNHTYVDGLCHIWHRPSGIDLRSRSTRRELDAVLTDVQPSLVILSPLYKAFRKGAREDHEDVAAELQAIIDDLRARFRFALIIEHHAAKGTAAARDMVPFGSSLWLRWPEYGIALTKVDKGDSSKVEFGRFRGDRVRNPGWPTTMEWGDNWPWLARYEHGTPWVSQTEMDF
jgi:replicative DNA helicase